MKENSHWKYYYPTFDFINDFPAETSPWWGHMFFAYDLIANLKPNVIVELGTYKGNSFFSFAQSVKDNKFKTVLHCIDSWEGDEHAGFFGDELYKDFLKKYKKYFKNIDIHIHKEFFDDAVSKFADNSIDLLHIDGLHTYEAVKHDFETWLPKVNKNSGVIMLHDICEIRDDFGVYKLWNELQKKYKTISFNHYHGLGVILLGNNKIFNPEIINNLTTHYRIIANEGYLEQKPSNLEKINKENEKLITLLLEESIAQKARINSIQNENNHLSLEANEFRIFKSSKIWKALTKWRKFKNLYPKIGTLIKK